MRNPWTIRYEQYMNEQQADAESVKQIINASNITTKVTRETQTEPQLSTTPNSPVKPQALENDKNDLDDSLPETTAFVLSSASASSSYADDNDENTSLNATVSK